MTDGLTHSATGLVRWLFGQLSYWLIDCLPNCKQVVDGPTAVISKPIQVSKKRMFRRRVEGLYRTSKKLTKPSHVIYPCPEPTNEKKISPEELQRLSKALEEINKKILSQNLVWKNFLSSDFGNISKNWTETFALNYSSFVFIKLRQHEFELFVHSAEVPVQVGLSSGV